MRWLRRRLCRWAADDAGGVLVASTFAMTGLLGIAAVVIDVNNARMLNRHLQVAADAAALAAVTELGDEAAADALAADYGSRNMPVEAHGDVILADDVSLGRWDEDARTFTPGGTPANAVEVIAQRTGDRGNIVPTFFYQVLGFDGFDARARSVAVVSGGGVPCLLALKRSGTAIEINSDSAARTTDCSIHSNGNMTLNSGSDAVASGDGSQICVDGSASGSGYSPSPVDCGELEDPLAGLGVPGLAGLPSQPTGDRCGMMQPGIYNGDVVINGCNATMTAGLYVMSDGGKFEVNSGSSVTATGVTIFLNGAEFKVNSDSSIDLSAPTGLETTGYPGIPGVVLMDNGGNGADKHEINSDSSSNIEGIVYLPDSELSLNSYGSATSSYCAMYIAEEFKINSDSTLNITGIADSDTCDWPVPGALVGAVALVD